MVSGKTLILALLLALGLPPAVGAEPRQQVVALETRPGVEVRFYLTEPEQPPAAAVILLAGGEGVINVAEDKLPDHAKRGNFLVRSRALFAGHGLLVATLDRPSDNPGGINAGFRVSADHAADIGAVARWLKQRSGLPVWLAGTSMGTLSATNAAVRLGPGVIDGVVLTSTITRALPKWAIPNDGVLGLGLETLTVPVLELAHRADGCHATPPGDAPKVVEKAALAPRKAAVLLDGGAPEESQPCEARAHHGFIGQEPEAVAAVAGFILGH